MQDDGRDVKHASWIMHRTVTLFINIQRIDYEEKKGQKGKVHARIRIQGIHA
jgi:hypothetical protein